MKIHIDREKDRSMSKFQIFIVNAKFKTEYMYSTIFLIVRGNREAMCFPCLHEEWVHETELKISHKLGLVLMSIIIPVT